MNYNVFTGFKEQPGRWEVVGGREGEGRERNRLLSIYRLIFDLLQSYTKYYSDSRLKKRITADEM